MGIRPGKKLHETMISEDDARRTLEFDDYFVIQLDFSWWLKESDLRDAGGKPCADGFSYRSDTNSDWLTID